MTEDQLTRDMLMAAATVYRGTAGTNGDLPTNVSLPDIDEVTQILQSNDAWKILERQSGEDRIGTGPVRDCYVGLGHTNLYKSLNALTGFQSLWNYANPSSSPMKSEEGAVNKVRFFLSSVGPLIPFASRLGRTVYPIFIQGMESLGLVEQDNFSNQLLYRGPEFSDSLYQNVTLGWTMAEVPRILNDLWLTQYQVTL